MERKISHLSPPTQLWGDRTISTVCTGMNTGVVDLVCVCFALRWNAGLCLPVRQTRRTPASQLNKAQSVPIGRSSVVAGGTSTVRSCHFPTVKFMTSTQLQGTPEISHGAWHFALDLRPELAALWERLAGGPLQTTFLIMC